VSLDSNTSDGLTILIDKFPGLPHRIHRVLAALGSATLCIGNKTKLIELRMWYQTMRAWAEALISNSGKKNPNKSASELMMQT